MTVNGDATVGGDATLTGDLSLNGGNYPIENASANQIVEFGATGAINETVVTPVAITTVTAYGCTVNSPSAAAQLCYSVESGGVLCATGHAALANAAAPPAIDTLPLGALPQERPKASESNLAPGISLGLAPVTIDRAALTQYLADIREQDDVYLRENLVHPGQILRLCNAALVQSVVLGPWIHVGSRLRNFSAARVGQELTLRNRITSNGVSKGHAIVEFDALAVADGVQVIAQITHTAIWRPRHALEAA